MAGAVGGREDKKCRWRPLQKELAGGVAAKGSLSGDFAATTWHDGMSIELRPSPLLTARRSTQWHRIGTAPTTTTIEIIG